jgi:hypothetical protein
MFSAPYEEPGDERDSAVAGSLVAPGASHHDFVHKDGLAALHRLLDIEVRAQHASADTGPDAHPRAMCAHARLPLACSAPAASKEGGLGRCSRVCWQGAPTAVPVWGLCAQGACC